MNSRNDMKKDFVKTVLSLIYSIMLLMCLILWKYTGLETFVIAGLILVSIIPIVYVFVDFSNLQTKLILYFIMLFLLLHYSLASDLLTGSDIHGEYVFAKLVMKNHLWTPNITTVSTNFVFPVIFLEPILSLVSGYALVTIMKTAPNVIYALVIVLIFEILRSLLKDKNSSFFASYFFIIFPGTYFVMPSVTREEFSEFMWMILVFLIINRVIYRKIRHDIKFTFILILLSVNITFFHYGFSIVYLFYTTVFFILYLLLQRFQNDVQKRNLDPTNNLYEYLYKSLRIIIVSLALSWIPWYMLIHNTLPGTRAVKIVFKWILFGFSPERSGITYVNKVGLSNLSWVLSMSTLIVFYGFILVGFIIIIVKFTKLKYKTITLPYLISSAIALAWPLFPLGTFGVLRSMHMVQYILLPLFGISMKKYSSRKLVILLGIFFSMSTLILTNTVSTTILGIPQNPALSLETFPDTWTTLPEYTGAKFLGSKFTAGTIFTDGSGRYPLHFSLIYRDVDKNRIVTTIWKENADIIYLSQNALQYNSLYIPKWSPSGLVWTTIKYDKSNIFRIILLDKNIIYTSKYSSISI